MLLQQCSYLNNAIQIEYIFVCKNMLMNISLCNLIHNWFSFIKYSMKQVNFISLAIEKFSGKLINSLLIKISKQFAFAFLSDSN